MTQNEKQRANFKGNMLYDSIYITSPKITKLQKWKTD